MTARLCNIDLHDGDYIVQTYSRTTDGFWVLDGQPVRLPGGTSPGDLGQAALDALARSREGVDTPARDEDTASPLLEMTGTRNYATYARGTRSVGVRVNPTPDGESIKVTPKRNGAPREGFVPIRQHQVVFAYDSPGQIGKAVIEAFQHAT